jgi:hypothetical protein
VNRNAVLQARADRFAFLIRVYERAQGSTLEHVPLSEIIDDLGFERDHADQLGHYLVGEGLLEWATMGPTMSITHFGVTEVEQAIAGRETATEHFPAFVVAENLIQVSGDVVGSVLQQGGAAPAHPAPDPRVLEIKATGGSEHHIDFACDVQNYGTQPARVRIAAFVGEAEVVCRPATLDLLVNHPHQVVRVEVPRPELGQLMPECNNATTLYGSELRLVLRDGPTDLVVETWREEKYDPESDRGRSEVQQRYWRIGRGEATETDLRADAISEMHQRQIRKHGGG